MKNKVIALLLALIMCASLVLCVSAKSEMYVVDPNYLLSDSEWEYLESYGEMIEESYGYTIMFALTADVSDSGSTTQYCEDMYYTFAESDNGVIVTHNLDENVYSWYCAGKGEKVFTEAVIEKLWALYSNTDTYYDGIYAFYEQAEVVAEAASLKAPVANAGNENDEEAEEEETVDVTEFIPVERELPLVVDNANLLSVEEVTDLIERLEAFALEYESEIAILTIEDLDGKTPQEYADDFYDYYGYGYGENDDGMLVLYKPGAEGERELYISTHGTGVDDYYADDFINAMVDYLIAEDYVSAFNTYIDIAEKSHKFSVSPMWIILSIVFGMLGGIAIPKVMASANKSVRPQNDASVYAKQDSMIITGNADLFVNSNIVRVAKPKKEGSSTHTSSSGRSHGGGGTSF